MAEIYIHYGKLEESIEKAQKICDAITNYTEQIKMDITTQISVLSGQDSLGYTSSASSMALEKISSLSDKASRFSSYKSGLDSLLSIAKSKDTYVSEQIETIAGMYVEERRWYQNIGDWIYNTFCVDLPNKWGLTRGIVDAGKWVLGRAVDAVQTASDWFTYGDGKYIGNILGSVVKAGVAIGGAILSVAGAVGAVAAAPVTGGATIPLVITCVGAAAASISGLITLVNSGFGIKQNLKALANSGNIFNKYDGNPSIARYFGSQTTFSSYLEKNDWGGKETNQFWEGVGEKVDTTKEVADTLSFVCSIAKLGVVYTYDAAGVQSVDLAYNGDKWYKSYSFTSQNIKNNILNEMGFTSAGTLDLSKAFNIKNNLFATNYNQQNFTFVWNGGSIALPEKTVNFFRGCKISNNLINVGDSVGTIVDSFTYRDTSLGTDDVLASVDATSGLLSNFKFFAPIDKYVSGISKEITDLIKQFTG